MVFHLGTSLLQYSNISVMIRIDGVGGYMYVPRAAYSFSMSFCIVPDIFLMLAPCFFASAMYNDNRIKPVALMVIEVEMSSSLMSLKSISISSRESIATP